jgi:peptidoglycan hydrolase-like protein with peptidoglycan-binding domain
MFTHYTAGQRAATRAAGVAQVRGIQAFHMGPQRGWADIGYSFLVDDEGNIYEGRGWGVAGGHTANWNSKSHAVCAILNDGQQPTPAMLAALRFVHDEHDQKYGKGFHRSHRDVNPTSCPGDILHGWMQAGMPVAGGASPPPPPAAPIKPDEAAPFRRYAAAINIRNLSKAGTLKFPQTGGAVLALQRSLNLAANKGLVEDGIFGAATTAAVKDLQRLFRLEVDGIVGPRTKEALFFLLGRIERGEA